MLTLIGSWEHSEDVVAVNFDDVDGYELKYFRLAHIAVSPPDAGLLVTIAGGDAHIASLSDIPQGAWGIDTNGNPANVRVAAVNGMITGGAICLWGGPAPALGPTAVAVEIDQAQALTGVVITGPVFQAAGTPTTTAAGVGLTTVAYPAVIQAGEYLELTVVATSAVGLSINAPSGWTQVLQDGVASVRMAVFYKIAIGSEGGTIALSATGTINGKTASIIERYSGVDTSTPYEEETSHVETSGAALNGNAITTSAPNELVVDKFASVSGFNMTPATGWTEDYDFNLGGAGPDVFSGGSHKPVPSAGAVSAEAASHNAGSAVEYIAFTYALIPA